MRFSPSDLWPGAARVWHRGERWGLVLAVLFACVLNVALLTGMVWPFWVTPHVKWACLLVVAAGWGFGVWESQRARRIWARTAEEDPQLDLFLAARAEYLRGNREEAERYLAQVLQKDEQDVEARLLLATLYRHARRWDDAKEQLRRLQRWRKAACWNREIRREWEQISKAESVLEEKPSSPRRAGFVRSRAKVHDSAANKAA